MHAIFTTITCLTEVKCKKIGIIFVHGPLKIPSPMAKVIHTNYRMCNHSEEFY